MQQHQYSLQFIQHEVQGGIVEQRASDGYINATHLCKESGKDWYEYTRSPQTKAFIDELESDTGIPRNELIQSLRGGVVQGTWIHPRVAVHFGQWLSPKFAVQVSKWVYDWMSGKTPTVNKATLPEHLDRYLKNDNKVPAGYFSVLQQTALGLFGPLHQLGFDIPKTWVPDISVGRLFCDHLRKDHGIDTDALPIYKHNYHDGRPLSDAKLYPEELLPVYLKWFRTVWLPINGVKYFKSKDPASLAFLDQMPALAAPKSPTKKAIQWKAM